MGTGTASKTACSSSARECLLVLACEGGLSLAQLGDVGQEDMDAYDSVFLAVGHELYESGESASTGPGELVLEHLQFAPKAASRCGRPAS